MKTIYFEANLHKKRMNIMSRRAACYNKQNTLNARLNLSPCIQRILFCA